VDRRVVPTYRRRRTATALLRNIEMIGASMFIAAFVAGLAVQIGFKEAGKHSIEFVEEWGRR
jgi:hypothetical protein